MDFDNLTMEEIEQAEFLPDEVIEKMSFAELCIYQEMLNKLKARYEELKAQENNKKEQ